MGSGSSGASKKNTSTHKLACFTHKRERERKESLISPMKGRGDAVVESSRNFSGKLENTTHNVTIWPFSEIESRRKGRSSHQTEKEEKHRVKQRCRLSWSELQLAREREEKKASGEKGREG